MSPFPSPLPQGSTALVSKAHGVRVPEEHGPGSRGQIRQVIGGTLVDVYKPGKCNGELRGHQPEGITNALSDTSYIALPRRIEGVRKTAHELEEVN